jgi:hypothetical protein
MSRENFFVCTDSGNKMPHLTHGKPSKFCHYWIEYQNNKPVKGHLHPEEVQIYDYSKNEFFAVHDGFISLTGRAMPKIQNFKHV